jgi:hypothetical protein
MRWCFLFVIAIIVSCQSKTDNWQKDLTACEQQVDSARVLLSDSLDLEEMNQELRDGKSLFRQLKMLVAEDTLDIVFGKQMDLFVTALKNAEDLDKEYQHCQDGMKSLKTQIEALKKDIANNAGDRSAYCEEVGLGKKDAAQVLKHAKDIHDRFVTLREARVSFEPVFEIYRSR